MDTSRHRALRTTRNSSLLSIPESDESTASPHRPATPIQPDLNLSRRSLKSTRKASLMSIPESDESTASPHRPATPYQSDLDLSHRSFRSTRKASLMSIPEMEGASVQSPSPRKRHIEYSLTPNQPLLKKSRKSVTFGPVLSPEVFDKRLPSCTPVKTGLTPKGQRRSLPAFEIVPEEEEEASYLYEYSMTGFEVSWYLHGCTMQHSRSSSS